VRSKTFLRVSDDTEPVDCRVTSLGYLKKSKAPLSRPASVLKRMALNSINVSKQGEL
jgi:hypothetical protein